MVGGKSGRVRLVVLGAVVLAACGSLTHLPQTPSELVKGSSYLPLTPKPIALKNVTGVKSAAFLNSLPNETMRISIGSRDETGSLTFGSSAIGQEHHSYEVIVDYIKYAT